MILTIPCSIFEMSLTRYWPVINTSQPVYWQPYIHFLKRLTKKNIGPIHDSHIFLKCICFPYSKQPLEQSFSTPSQPTADVSLRSQPKEGAHNAPILPSQALHTSNSAYLDSSPPTSAYRGTAIPQLSYLGSSAPVVEYVGTDPTPLASSLVQTMPNHGNPHASYRTDILTHPNYNHILQQHPHANQDGPMMGQQKPPMNGFDASVLGLGGSPVLCRRNSQGSPVLSRQASLGQGSQQSPVLSRQPSLGQPIQSSPVLGRQPSIGNPQGSPIMGHHSSMTQVSQRSPTLDGHPMHSGYTIPDERHGNLSRQSSSSGYQGPPTPCFPVSPMPYQDERVIGTGVGFRQGSPAPGVQPQLPEKRRMSSGDRPNGGLSYGTLNGRIRSPASGGSTPSYFHTLSDFSRFNTLGKTVSWFAQCSY